MDPRGSLRLASGHTGPLEELHSSGDDYMKIGGIREVSAELNNHQVIKCQV